MQTTKTSQMESKFTFLGINSDKDFCTCCGKSDLSKVVWFEDNTTGEIIHVGTTCGSKMKGSGFKKPSMSTMKKIQMHIDKGQMSMVHSFKGWIKDHKIEPWIKLCNDFENSLL